MSDQNTARSLTGSVMNGLPAIVTENPDEASAPAGASFAADAPAAQAGTSSGPGTLAYAIARWHANHPEPSTEVVIAVSRPPMHTVEPPSDVRCAATRIGCTIAEYCRRLHNGERWCPRCRGWRANWRSAEGRTPYCHPCMLEYRRARYQQSRTPQPPRRKVYGIAYAGPSFSTRRAV